MPSSLINLPAELLLQIFQSANDPYDVLSPVLTAPKLSDMWNRYASLILPVIAARTVTCYALIKELDAEMHASASQPNATSSDTTKPRNPMSKKVDSSCTPNKVDCQATIGSHIRILAIHKICKAFIEDDEVSMLRNRPLTTKYHETVTRAFYYFLRLAVTSKHSNMANLSQVSLLLLLDFEIISNPDPLLVCEVMSWLCYNRLSNRHFLQKAVEKLYSPYSAMNDDPQSP